MVERFQHHEDGSKTITLTHLKDWDWEQYIGDIDPQYLAVGPTCQKKIPNTHKRTHKNLWTKPSTFDD